MGLFSRRKSLEQIDQEVILASLTLFPGSVEEYANFRGYDVEVVGTGRQDKGVFFGGVSGLVPDRELIIGLVNRERVEALVNVCPLLAAGTSYYGLPVRRKK